MELGNLSVPITADLGPLEDALTKVQRLLGDFEAKAGGANNALDDMERKANSTSGALGTLAKQLAAVFTVRELINFTDTWTDLTSRVNLAAGSIDKGAAVMDRLNDLARRTYSSLELTAESYISNSTTLRDLGKSTDEALTYTEALNNALVVSGAKADRAARVQDALAKGMAAGKLSGDQLNTVIESGGRVAEVLAEELGTTVSGLRAAGSQGKITGDVIYNSLTKRLEQLTEEAESMPATIGDAFQLISNALLQTIGTFDQATEISGTLAEGLILVADNMQRLLTYVATATTGWVAYTGVVAAANAGLFTFNGLLALTRVALIRLGLGAIIVFAGELVYQFTRLVSSTGGFGNALTLLGEVADGVWKGMVISAQAIPVGLQSVWFSIRADFVQMVAELGAVWNNFLSTFEKPALTVGFMGNEYELIGGLDLSAFKHDLDAASSSAETLRQRSAELSSQAGTLATQGYDKAREALAKLNIEMEKNAADLTGDGGPSRIVPGAAGGGAGKKSQAERDAERAAEAYQKLIEDSQAFVAQQEIERQTIGLTELEAAKLRAEFDLLNQAKRAGIELTPQMAQELTNLAHQMAEAEVATARLREQYDFAKDTFKGFFTDLKNELQNGASVWEAFGKAAANALQKIADKALDLALSGIFDMIFNAFGGGRGGGFLGKLLGFENGTSYAPGGYAVVGERGPEIMKIPGGAQIIPNHRINAPAEAQFGGNAGGGVSKVALEVFVKDDGKIGAIARQEAGQVVEVAIHDYDTNQLPASVERVGNHPRMR